METKGERQRKQKRSDLNETEEFLLGVVNPDQAEQEGYLLPKLPPRPPALPESKTVVIECSNGDKREVVYHLGSRLVRHSRVISEASNAGEAVEQQGLSDRQCRGLGVPPGTKPHELVNPADPEAPIYDRMTAGRWV